MAGTLGDKFRLHVLGHIDDAGLTDIHNATYPDDEVPLMIKWVIEHLLDENVVEIKITREDV